MAHGVGNRDAFPGNGHALEIPEIVHNILKYFPMKELNRLAR
jgi:hypothetical protein